MSRPALILSYLALLLACGRPEADALQEELQAEGGLSYPGIPLQEIHMVPREPTEKDVIEPFNPGGRYVRLGHFG